jgi:16S rRNA (cytidine1402-2'-O)-methyltransferase
VHEEALRGTLPELARRFRERGTVRGEITVVVEGAADEAHAQETDDDLDDRIRAGLASGVTVKELSRRLAKESGRTARSIYARALALRTP